MKITVVEAGVGPGHPKKKCDWCNKEEKLDEDGYSDLIATCTYIEYLTLCQKCYKKAGNKVR